MERKIKSFYTDESKIYINMEDNSLMQFDNTIENLKNVDDLLKVQTEDRIEEINDKLRESMPYNGKDAAITITRLVTEVGVSYLGFGSLLSYTIRGDASLAKSLLIGAGSCAVPFVVTLTMEKTKKAKWKKNKVRLEDEREKLEFINDNLCDLRQYPKYVNSLSGLTQKQVEHIENCELPFTVLDTDKFKIEDLERIVDNIRIENKIIANTLKKTKPNN